MPLNDLGPATAPDNYPISIRAFGDEDASVRLGRTVGDFVSGFSRVFDMSSLDGVTIAGDYGAALAELDRGYETNFSLTPSDRDVIGIAMTPSVLRDGALKSHLMFDAGFVAHLLDPQDPSFPLAVHIVAHECAHVEITAAFDRCFPDILLRSKQADIHQQLTWQVIFACWDEYAATRRSAPFGEDRTQDYQTTLLEALSYTRERADAEILGYRTHGDVDEVLCSAYGHYGQLLKLSAYLIGHMDGVGLQLSDLPETRAALESHWFRPFFEDLAVACRAIHDQFGSWTDQAAFEALGDLVDRVLESGGLFLTPMEDGLLHVDVP